MSKLNIHLYPSQFLNESRILREARSLSRFGIFEAIDLVGSGGGGLPAEERVSPGVVIRRFGRRRENRTLLGKVADAVKWSGTVFRAYRQEPLACINCHSVAMLPLACLLKWFTGARLVYDAHELETETSGLGGFRKAGTKLVERCLVHQADFSIFVGQAIDEWYRSRYGLTNTAVIYNAPTGARPQATDVFRSLYDIPHRAPIFLYQGVLSEARGIPNVVEAFSSLQDTALVIMGYGELADWVKGRAAAQANLYFHAAVPPDELARYTAGADFGLSVIEPTSLSYEYCMPNKLFEYLMAGKPVLVSPTREQRQFVERFGAGVVLGDTSVEAIICGVRELLARDRASMAAAIDRIRSEFCWESQERRLREIYEERLGFEVRPEPV